MFSSNPVSPALSLLACGPHYHAVISSIPVSSSTQLITALCVCVDPGALPLCISPWFLVLGFLFPYPDYWTCLCLCPSDFGWNSCMAMICISSIVYVLCMKFDRGVWITFRMIFLRHDGAFLSVSCFACNRVCACHFL